jgi:hypothetical protein
VAGLLQALARELDRTHPGAAASLREGLAETLGAAAWLCVNLPVGPGVY